MTRSTATAAFTAAIGALLLLTAAPLTAQTATPVAAGGSTAKGLIISAHLNGSRITAKDVTDESDSGVGFGLQLGYGFTSQLAIVLSGTAAAMKSDERDDYTLTHYDVMGRYSFTGPTRRLVPFVEAGYTRRELSMDDVTLDLGNSPSTDDISVTGNGITLGGGAQYYVSPKLALGVGLKWTTGDLTTVKFGNVSIDGQDIDSKTLRLDLGVTWYPMPGW